VVLHQMLDPLDPLICEFYFLGATCSGPGNRNAWLMNCSRARHSLRNRYWLGYL